MLPPILSGGPVAWYDVDSYDSVTNKWMDKSGKKRNVPSASIIGVTYGTNVDGVDGVSKSFRYLTGTPTSQITFNGSYGIPMTICSMTKYISTSSSNQRILRSTTVNWLHGQWSTNAGNAYFGNGFFTARTSTVTPITNWVYMCSSLPVSGSALVYANGMNVLNCGGPCSVTVAPGVIGINPGSPAPNYDEAGEFAIAELILWNRALTFNEIFEMMNTYFPSKYGVPSVPSSQPSSSKPTNYKPTSHPSSSRPSSSRPSRGNFFFHGLGIADPNLL